MLVYSLEVVEHLMLIDPVELQVAAVVPIRAAEEVVCPT